MGKEVEFYLEPRSVPTEAAEAVCKRFWEEAHPKPLSPYNTVRGLVRRCLEAGYEEAEIIAALHGTDAYTMAALEYTLRSSRRQARNQISNAAERIMMIRQSRG